jgi:hypothetical protein
MMTPPFGIDWRELTDETIIAIYGLCVDLLKPFQIQLKPVRKGSSECAVASWIDCVPKSVRPRAETTASQIGQLSSNAMRAVTAHGSELKVVLSTITSALAS